MSSEKPRQEENGAALMRMVDFRIPLPWLLGGFGAGVVILIGMYYQLQAVNNTLTEVRTTLAATTVVLTQLSAQQALTTYRLDKLEARQGGNHEAR